MKKAYYITQHTKPLPMHTVKAKFVHSTADTKLFSFQSKKSHTFYKKEHTAENSIHFLQRKSYTSADQNCILP